VRRGHAATVNRFRWMREKVVRCRGVRSLGPLDKDTQRVPRRPTRRFALIAAVEARHGVKGDQAGAAKLIARRQSDRTPTVGGSARYSRGWP
jgi:hypothetical protein